MDALNQELGFARIAFMQEESQYNFVLEESRNNPDDEYLKSMLVFARKSYESTKKVLEELENEYYRYLEDL